MRVDPLPIAAEQTISLYVNGVLQQTQPYVENWLRPRQSVSNITHNFSTPVFKTDLGKLTTQELQKIGGIGKSTADKI